MHRPGKYAFTLVTAATLAALASCGTPGSEDRSELEHVATRGADIINGTSSNTAESMGWVSFTHTITDSSGGFPVGTVGSCSASVLRNDLVLTARHCVTTNAVLQGPVDNNWANFGPLRMGSQTRSVAGIFPHPTLDAALLRVDNFLSVNGARFGWNRPVASALLNEWVDCYGYGRTTCAGASSGLNQATVKVHSFVNGEIVLATNAAGQNAAQGDSGGSCVRVGGALIGVVSHGVCGHSAVLVDGANLNSWLYGPGVGLLPHVYPDASVYTSPNSARSSVRIADSPALIGALPQVISNYNPVGRPATRSDHHYGVFTNSLGRFTIYPADGTSIEPSVSFNVSFDTSVYSFWHQATAANNFGIATVLDHPLLNDKPNATIFVTRGSPFFNDPVGVGYLFGRWMIVSEGAVSPTNAGFFVRIVRPSEVILGHRTTAANTVGHFTRLDNPNLNGQPNARILVSHRYAQGKEIRSPLGVLYDTATQRWAIFTERLSPLPLDTWFNVLVLPGHQSIQL